MEIDPNLFLSVLQKHRNGALLSDASLAFAELIQGVRLAGKAGTLTVKLTLKPAARGQGLVILNDQLNEKIPRVEVEESVWFATEDGRLTKDDPRQQRLDLKVHTTPAPVPANLEPNPQSAHGA